MASLNKTVYYFLLQVCKGNCNLLYILLVGGASAATSQIMKVEIAIYIIW